MCVRILLYTQYPMHPVKFSRVKLTLSRLSSPITVSIRQPDKRSSVYYRAEFRFATSQWETALLCNDVSHWLGGNLASALYYITVFDESIQYFAAEIKVLSHNTDHKRFSMLHYRKLAEAWITNHWWASKKLSFLFDTTSMYTAGMYSKSHKYEYIYAVLCFVMAIGSLHCCGLFCCGYATRILWFMWLFYMWKGRFTGMGEPPINSDD